MYIDIVTGHKMQNDILKSVELELGRKLNERELEVFRKASRKGLVKGCRYGVESCKL